MPNPVDHLLVIVLLALPVYSYFSYRRTVARAEAGEVFSRPQLYAQTQALEWALFAAVAGLWLVGERPLADLGFIEPGGAGFAWSVLASAAALGYLLLAWQKVRQMDASDRARQVDALGDLRFFLPVDRRDFRHFCGLSVTAGFVEEIVFRGFLFWYLGQYMPLWAVVLVSSLIFGLAHSYQGVGGIVRVFGVGIGFALLYHFSGSLWLPMVVHALGDILQGRIVLELLRSETRPAETAA